MKTTKLYSMNIEKVTGKNIGLLNPTCKAMVKTMFRLVKDNEDFEGISGEDLLKECVKNKTWTTTQSPDKYHTTFAFYKKKMIDEWNFEVVDEIPAEDVIEILE